jgi:hypothetical protein
MSVTFLLLTLVPIIAFAIADAMAGLKTGVIVAIVLSVALCAVNWIILGKFDPISLIEPVFFIILGLISLHLKNSIWFKFQPVVVNVLSALLLAGFQIWSEPFLVRWAPAMDKLMPPENQGFLVSPLILQKLSLISHVLIYVLLLHAFWVGWAALKRSTWFWTAVRLSGYPLLLGAVVICMLV